MQINDLHIHLYPSPSMEQEMSISSQMLEPVFANLSNRISGAGIENSMAIVLDTNALRNETSIEFFDEKKRQGKYANISLAICLDFRAKDSLKLVELAWDLDFRCLKFLPYEQKIGTVDYDQVAGLARRADELGLFIMVCCAFGTRQLYDYNGVRLAACLSEQVKCPVIMAHGGGARVLDAFCATLDAPNLYLDLSFSLPLYIESSVEDDFAFAMKKLGSQRWAFGSDAPFVELRESVSVTLDFLERYRFPDEDIRNIMFNTSDKLLKHHW